MYEIKLTASEKTKRESILKLMIKFRSGNGNRRYSVVGQ